MQSFHGSAFENGGADEFVCIFGLNAYIEDAAGIENDERSEFAEAVTACDHDAHPVVQAVVVYGGLQRVTDVHAAGGGASRASADEDLVFVFVTGTLIVPEIEERSGFFPESVEFVNGGEAFEFKHVVHSFMPGSCREYRECRRGSGGRACAR